MIENHHGLDGEDYAAQYPEYGEGCLLQCDCSAECYRDDSSHREYRSGHGGQRVLGTGGWLSPRGDPQCTPNACTVSSYLAQPHRAQDT